MTRVLFGTLAVVDAILLVYLFTTYDWFHYGINESSISSPADFRAAMIKKCGAEPDRDRAACFAFAPDLPPFAESDDERLMRAFCELARNGEGCHRYALLMDTHPDGADRAARYRALACKRGYAPACS